MMVILMMRIAPGLSRALTYHSPFCPAVFTADDDDAHAGWSIPLLHPRALSPSLQVVQKYIERPLLLGGDRKFDIRLLVLVTPDRRVYMYRDSCALLKDFDSSSSATHRLSRYAQRTASAIILRWHRPTCCPACLALRLPN